MLKNTVNRETKMENKGFRNFFLSDPAIYTTPILRIGIVSMPDSDPDLISLLDADIDLDANPDPAVRVLVWIHTN